MNQPFFQSCQTIDCLEFISIQTMITDFVRFKVFDVVTKTLRYVTFCRLCIHIHVHIHKAIVLRSGSHSTVQADNIARQWISSATNYFFLFLVSAAQNRTSIYFSYITTLTGPGFRSGGAIPVVDLALEQINNRTDILPNYTLNYTTIHDSEVKRK